MSDKDYDPFETPIEAKVKQLESTNANLQRQLSEALATIEASREQKPYGWIISTHSVYRFTECETNHAGGRSRIWKTMDLLSETHRFDSTP